MNRLIIEDLSFHYGKKCVLNEVNLEITNGLYGLLGRNGAGKSTLMRIVVGLLHSQYGKIEVCGETNVRAIRRIVGYLPQDFDFYAEMRVEEALIYLGTLDGIPKRQLQERVHILLELVNLLDVRHKRIKQLSGGMKRRLGIAQSLLNNPRVLVVDEPTAGLDPEERIRFRNLLKDLSSEKIVLFSTHIASDLEKIADNIGILDKGRLIYNGTTQHLIEKCSGGIYETVIPIEEWSQFKARYIVFEQREVEEGLLVRFIYNGRPLTSFVRIAPPLESAYLLTLYSQEGRQCG